MRTCDALLRAGEDHRVMRLGGPSLIGALWKAVIDGCSFEGRRGIQKYRRETACIVEGQCVQTRVVHDSDIRNLL